MCAEKSDVCCSSGPKLIFACSGAADVGEISDRAARKLNKDGTGRIFCLVGIGGRIEPIIKKTEQASKILVIDGCELDCAKNCLEEAGFTKFEHLRITNLGMEKGKTEIAEENITKVAEKGRILLG